MRSLTAFLLLPACLTAQTPATAPILERMAKDQLVSAEDFLAAAQALAESSKAADALAARELALVAWIMGKPNALVARSTDNFLRTAGRSPRFAEVVRGDTQPTDAHRLDFLVEPLTPMADAKARIEERLVPSWWAPEKKQPFHNVLDQASQVPRDQALSDNVRGKLVKIYREDKLRTAEDLAAAAKVLTRSADPGDLLLANELAALAAVRGNLMSRILFAQTWDRAARALNQPARYGTLGSQTMDPSVAPGVIRALGFSGRPTKR